MPAVTADMPCRQNQEGSREQSKASGSPECPRVIVEKCSGWVNTSEIFKQQSFVTEIPPWLLISRKWIKKLYSFFLSERIKWTPIQLKKNLLCSSVHVSSGYAILQREAILQMSHTTDELSRFERYSLHSQHYIQLHWSTIQDSLTPNQIQQRNRNAFGKLT